MNTPSKCTCHWVVSNHSVGMLTCGKPATHYHAKSETQLCGEHVESYRASFGVELCGELSEFTEEKPSASDDADWLHHGRKWRIVPRGDGSIEVWSGLRKIATIHSHPDSVLAAETEATARLVAALPELVDALDGMVRTFSSAMMLDENGRDEDGETYECVEKAMKVLAKAKKKKR